MVAAERRVEDHQGQQVVGRGTGGDKLRVRLGELSRPTAAVQRADGRDIIASADRHGQVRVAGGHRVNTGPSHAEKPTRMGTGRHVRQDHLLALLGVRLGQRDEGLRHRRGVVDGHDHQRRRVLPASGHGVAQVRGQALRLAPPPAGPDPRSRQPAPRAQVTDTEADRRAEHVRHVITAPQPIGHDSTHHDDAHADHEPGEERRGHVLQGPLQAGMVIRGGRVQHLAALDHRRRGRLGGRLVVGRRLLKRGEQRRRLGAVGLQCGELALPGRRVGFRRNLADLPGDAVEVLLCLGDLGIKHGLHLLLLPRQKLRAELQEFRGQRLGQHQGAIGGRRGHRDKEYLVGDDRGGTGGLKASGALLQAQLVDDSLRYRTAFRQRHVGEHGRHRVLIRVVGDDERRRRLVGGRELQIQPAARDEPDQAGSEPEAHVAPESRPEETEVYQRSGHLVDRAIFDRMLSCEAILGHRDVVIGPYLLR